MDPFAPAAPLAPDAFPATDALGLDPVLVVGPRLPEDYRPAKKPARKQLLADCEDLLTEHRGRLLQTHAMHAQLAAFRGDFDVGHFENDEQDIENGDVEVYPLDDLRAELEFNNGVIASMSTYIEHLSRERIDADEVLTIEDGAYFLLDCFARQHARQVGTNWRRDLPNVLQRCGGLVSKLTLDPDDPHCGLEYELLDPATCFPVWAGRRGISDLFRVYEAAAGDVIGAYGDPGGRVERQVMRLARTSANDAVRADRNKPVEVKEHWNADWVTVLVEDEVILTRRHGYARVPFVVTLGGFELPRNLSASAWTVWGANSREPGLHRTADGTPDAAAHWRPWLSRLQQAHAIMEAVAGRTLTQFKRSAFPPMIYEYDMLTKGQDTAELSYYEKTINRVPLGNKLSILPTGPDGPTAAVLDGFMQRSANQGLWTQVRTGAIPPQTPSAALGTMFDLGGADRSAITDAIAHHLRDVLEWALALIRDWGPVLGIPGERGALPIPARDTSGRTPVHWLTADVIQRAGVGLDVGLHIDRPDPALAQWLATMMSAGLSSPETALRKSRYVPDPLRELRRIEDAMLRQTPEIATQLKIANLQEQLDDAIAAEDWRTADDLGVMILQLEWNAQQQMTQGLAPPPAGAGTGGTAMGTAMGTALGGGVPNPNGMPGPGAVGAPLVAGGLSLPELGIGQAQQGGRPINSTQPREATAPRRVTAPPR